jgi:ribose 5-phosphate isomerase B
VNLQKKIKNKKIVIGSDHAGFVLKEAVKKYLTKNKKKFMDLGTNSKNSIDYPNIAHSLSKKVKNNNEFGILICGSGIGMSMAANRHKNIRAALCYNVKSAKLSRQHNDANVITLGSRLTSKKIVLKCIKVFLETSFSGGRHLRRVKKI